MITLHWTLFLLACSASMIFGYFVYALMYMAPCETPKMADDPENKPKPNTDDYIDWSKVPEGYDWVAVDGPKWTTDNKVWAYKMNVSNDTMEIGSSEQWGLKSDNGSVINASRAIIGPLPPWRESLRKRPGK